MNTISMTVEQLIAEERRVANEIATMHPKLDKDSANSTHADELVRIATEGVAVLNAERASDVAANGSDLAARIAEGKGVDSTASYAAIDARIRTATDHLAECTVAAQKLRVIHEAALNSLRRLETSKKEIEAALHKVQNETRAARIKEQAAKLHKMIDELADQYPTDLNRPIHLPRRVPPPAVVEALALRPGATDSDWINTPINKLRFK